MDSKPASSKTSSWAALIFGCVLVAFAVVTFVTPFGQAGLSKGTSGDDLPLKVWMIGIVLLVVCFVMALGAVRAFKRR